MKKRRLYNYIDYDQDYPIEIDDDQELECQYYARLWNDNLHINFEELFMEIERLHTAIVLGQDTKEIQKNIIKLGTGKFI